MNYNVKAPHNVKSWDRVRLHVNLEDYRSVKWPPLGPYWCSGKSDVYSIVVAYVPAGTTLKTLRLYWPEIKEVDRMQESIALTYSDRFPKPDWWID